MLRRAAALPLAALVLAALAPHAAPQCGPGYLQELLPPDPQDYTDLARTVSISGDVIATGSGKVDYDSTTGVFRGAVYVWRRTAGAFVLEQKIPGPPPPQALFGEAVAVDGDALVASQHASSYPAEAARVFRRIGGVWTEEAFLMPADPLTTNGSQVRAVGIQGDWVAVGHRTALAGPYPAPFCGAVYLYQRNGGVWSQQAKLVPGDALNGDQTGWSLDLRGDVLAFSSRASPFSHSVPGRVHVYGLHGGSPLLEATLTASTPGEGREFGYAIATDGERLAISDPDDRAVTGNIGAVYVFRRENGAWVEEQVLRPFLGAGAFGREVALDGDDLYAAAHPSWPSRIHHFRRVNGVWIEMGVAAPTNVPVWGIGALDAEAGTVAAGVPTVYNQSGGVYTFDSSLSQAVCTYCTAKINSQGCTPAIGWSGVPSESAGSGFSITASQLVPGQIGLLIYALTATQSTPFQGGFLCMAAPVTRTPAQYSGGSVACSGTFTFDFNAWIAGGVDPRLVTGTQVRAQYWSRDPGGSFATNLTDALSFVLAP